MNEEVSAVLKGLGADSNLPQKNRFAERIDALQAAVHDLFPGQQGPMGPVRGKPALAL